MTVPVFQVKGKSTLKQAQIKFMQDLKTLRINQNGLKLQEIQFKNELSSALKQKELQQRYFPEKIYKCHFKKKWENSVILKLHRSSTRS